MARKPSRYGELWNREELILAFDLYFRTPFAKTKASNPAVQSLARALDRSPASIARKLGNFGSFDPALQAKDISGLGHTGRLDQEVWNEFNNDWGRLAEEAERLKLQYRMSTEMEVPVWNEAPSGPSERVVTSKHRLHQAFFRDAVRANYDNCCCLTGLTIQECLTASHIVPWSVDERFRADPTNGLCLSATFDRLFDAGLMSVTAEYRAVFAAKLHRRPSTQVADLILCFEGVALATPRKLPPSTDRLSWHYQNIFKG
ncbi:MAG: HNH endonuclease [Planctomycetes bacterium]|nr:HNH endonuclease [Planctomycetota bacterium]